MFKYALMVKNKEDNNQSAKLIFKYLCRLINH